MSEWQPVRLRCVHRNETITASDEEIAEDENKITLVNP